MARRRASTIFDDRSTEELRNVAAAASTGEYTIRARSPVAVLRPLLLVLGVLVIGTVVLMLAAYHFGRTGMEGEGETIERMTPIDPEKQILAGRKFDYTQNSEGVPLFRIRADESQQDRDGKAFLTTVILDVFRQDGQTYTVESNNATVEDNKMEAFLEGDVRLSGWDQLELEARALELKNEGQVLVSQGEVQFRLPPSFAGRASKLHVDRESDTITLSGGVHLHTVEGAEEPMRLDCQRLVYQRAAGLVRAVGNAKLKSGERSIEAHYLTIFLKEDGRSFESIRARWNVVGQAVVRNDFGDPTEIEYRGQFIDVQPDPLDPTSDRIKLDGEGDTVLLKTTDMTGLSQTFSGFYLLGIARDGQLRRVEGVGSPVVLAEALDTPEPYFLRQLCAENIVVRFQNDGSLGQVLLEQRVELDDRDVHLSGGRKATLSGDGMFRIQGPEVHLSSSRGEVAARQFTFARPTGLIRAYSGVRALLAERSVKTLRGSPLTQGDGPVQVESEEAWWMSTPPTFSFDGNVRAWRGESLLLADQLNGDEQDQKLSASGGVRTIWILDGDTALAPGTDPAAQRQPVEVDSQQVAYLNDRNQLVYTGDVELRQGQSRIVCQELSVTLDKAGQAEHMICEEDVNMVDALKQREVRGDRAVYILAEEVVEIFGEEVEVLEGQGQGNRMRGRYVRYDLRAGTFNISSRPKEDVQEP